MKRTSSDRRTPRDPFDQGRPTWAGGLILAGFIIIVVGVLAAIAVVVLGMMDGQ